MARTSLMGWREAMSRIPSPMYRHHISGSCSAHPSRRVSMGISVLGLVDESTQAPDSISSSDTLIEEVPMSMPSAFIVDSLYNF